METIKKKNILHGEYNDIYSNNNLAAKMDNFGFLLKIV